MLVFRNILILFTAIFSFCNFSFATNKEDILNRISRLHNTPAAELDDSVRSISALLHSIDQQSARELAREMGVVTKGKNSEAYAICLQLYAIFYPGREIELIDSAYFYARHNGLDKFTLNYYETKSNYFREQGKLDSSMVYILKARDLAKTDDINEYIVILHQIGDIYYSVNMYDNALKYYNLVDSLKGDPVSWKSWRKWVVSNNIGLIDIAKGDYDKALSRFEAYYNSLPAPLKTYSDSLAMCYVSRKIGDILYDKGEYEAALKMLEFPLNMSLKYKLRGNLSGALITLIQISIKTGNKADVVKYNNLMSEHYNEISPYPEEKIYYTYINAEVNNFLGNYKKAAEYYRQYDALNDSTEIQERTAGLLQLLTEEEYNRLEANFNQVKKEQNYLFIIIGLLLFFGYIIFQRSQKIKKLNRLLVETNQTKDKLFSIISHDLKSPCSAMLGLSSIIDTSLKEKDYMQVAEYSQMLNQKSNELYALIINLLDWSRSQQGSVKLSLQGIKIDVILSRVVNLYESQAALKNIRIVYSKPDGDIVVVADEYSLLAVFSNLVSNAVKFTPFGGEITISVTPVKNRLEVIIADNGVGMSKEKLGRLFDRNNNESTWGTNNEKGTGLGLLICKEFVDKNGGTIKADSIEGKGTTFTVGLKW